MEKYCMATKLSTYCSSYSFILLNKKPNKRTKTPSVTFTQEEMIEVLKHINLIASHLEEFCSNSR